MSSAAAVRKIAISPELRRRLFLESVQRNMLRIAAALEDVAVKGCELPAVKFGPVLNSQGWKDCPAFHMTDPYRAEIAAHAFQIRAAYQPDAWITEQLAAWQKRSSAAA